MCILVFWLPFSFCLFILFVVISQLSKFWVHSAAGSLLWPILAFQSGPTNLSCQPSSGLRKRRLVMSFSHSLSDARACYLVSPVRNWRYIILHLTKRSSFESLASHTIDPSSWNMEGCDSLVHHQLESTRLFLGSTDSHSKAMKGYELVSTPTKAWKSPYTCTNIDINTCDK